MPVRNLDKILRPQRIAVIGASDDPRGVGQPVLRNLISNGFKGVVYPVNPSHESVQGMPAYPRVSALPKPPDLAVICTPAPTVPGLIRECGEIGVRGVLVITAGFREVGEEGRALEQRLLEEARRFDGMRILGPNCLGVIVPALRLNASFADGMPRPGNVAFLSQSGALCSSVLDWAVEEEIGVSTFLSIGNAPDVGFADLLDWLAADADTHSVILYIESVPEARSFLSAARAFARIKPIVAFKSGRFPESAKAAASHTGAMVAQDAVYDAVFQRAGIERVFEIQDMFQCAELLARPPRPRGPRLAIVTNAGGPGVMATDALLAGKGTLATLSDETLGKLDAELPRFWSHGNPVDVLGDAPPQRLAGAARTVLADGNVDAALVILTPQAMTDPTGAAKAVAEAAAGGGKPLLTSWMGGRSVRAGIRKLNRAGIPTYETPEQAVRAFLHLHGYARNLDVLYETPRDLPVSYRFERPALPEGAGLLGEADSKRLLAAYGIGVVEPQPAATADDAVAIAGHTGYPVVLKVLSPEITHKTEVGGVALDLHGEAEVRAAFESIVERARRLRPDAWVQGCTVQRMVRARDGFEMILGAKKDPVFGSVILAGMGGIAAEVFQDSALGLPPLNESLARRMVESLRSWPLLKGYRGRPGVDLDRLLETIIRFSYLVAEHGEIAELDVNPLLVTPRETIALDARVLLDEQRGRPYAHLAIRPYPQEQERRSRLRDGTPVLLRPIRPEDEPLWHAMIAACSAESIRFRWRYLFRDTSHDMASRYCYIDYDREMAMIAEIGDGAERKMIGNARLVADADHVTAEYAVVVADPWQGSGVGSLLTDVTLEIAKTWGVREVVAETTPDNLRMVAVFRRRGFTISRDEEGVVIARRTL